MVFYEKKGRYIIDFTDIPTGRAVIPEIPAIDRKANFKEVETGFSKEVAVAEAKRCLSCRRCLGCALCWAECKPEAIDFSLPDKLLELQHLEKIILTDGLQREAAPIATSISNKYMNVVSDLQVERMLADTGPSNGLILRPQDGEIPKNIVFVQTFKERNNAIRDALLIFGINEALIIRKRLAGIKVSIISPSMDSFQKDAKSGTYIFNVRVESSNPPEEYSSIQKFYVEVP